MLLPWFGNVEASDILISGVMALKDELLQWARKELTDKRSELVELREHMQKGQLDTSEGDSIKELSTYDNHPADIGSETFERSKDFALVGQLDRRIRQIDDALTAIDRGTYGTCENCGKDIALERIQAAPETTLCVDCRGELYDRGSDVSDRPVEEDVLRPPFGRTFTDESSEDEVGYDGEDTWQDVARYGTSNTPSDVPGARQVDEAFVDHDETQGVVEETDAVFKDEEGENDGRLTAEREKRTENWEA